MTISEHIKNIYNEEELDKKSTIRDFLTVQNEGNRTVKRNIDYYNLDLINVFDFHCINSENIKILHCYFLLEAPIGVGPIIRVLQTRALPLG